MMATSSDQGDHEYEQEHLQPGDEVQNNMVEVESTRHRRRCLLLVATVVLCFIVIGGGVSVPFVLPLINQSGFEKNTQPRSTDFTPTGEEKPSSDLAPKGEKPSSDLASTGHQSYSWTEWSPWTRCINTTCAVEFSKRERSCRLRGKSERFKSRTGSTCDESWQETRGCPFIPKTVPSDCAELLATGVTYNGTFTIDPDCQGPFQVYCDMTTDGGGWTVFQRRQDGSVEFNRTWDEYKTGFGNMLGEFWLGNEYIHRMTYKRNRTLRADLFERGGYYHYHGIYDNVSISSERYNYTLHVGSHRKGHASSLSWYENGQQFSTADRDNDQRSDENLAASVGGGWWYSYRDSPSPNGIYGRSFGWYDSRFDRLVNCDFKLR